jgi:hypothetical protein
LSPPAITGKMSRGGDSMVVRSWSGVVVVAGVVAVALVAAGCGDSDKPQPAPLCATSSTCAMRVHCSASLSCRCLKSAEGDIRCGQPPSCTSKFCSKSSDCSDLGEGYFCDAPNSGCCSDAEKSRCIPPCKEPPCPQARICAGKCCAEGETCVSGRCSRDGGSADGPAPADMAPPADAKPPVDAKPPADAGADARDAPAGDAPMAGPGVALDPEWAGVSPGTSAFLSQLARAWRGDPADLDGDGVAEVTSALLPDGTRRWEPAAAGGAGPAWFVEKNNTTGKTTIGLDLLPAAGFEVVEVFDRTTRTRVETGDRDGSGKPERRRTMRFDETFTTVEIVHEADAMESGTFVEVERTTAPASWDQGTCSGTSNFPTIYPYPLLNRSPETVADAPGVKIMSNNGASYDCTPMEAKKVADAFDCAIKRARACLPAANARLAQKFTPMAIANQGSLYVGCNNPCAGVLATTKGSVMNLSNAALNAAMPDEACSLIMHEMLHWEGEPGGAAHDANANDATYSCARYCANCTNYGKGAPGSPNVDCARCGETEAEKRRCGVQLVEVDVTCPTLALCHGGIGVNLACSTCKGVKESDCDMKPLSTAPTFSCCATCPAEAPRNTDKPCPGAPMPGPGTCAGKPPACP